MSSVAMTMRWVSASSSGRTRISQEELALIQDGIDVDETKSPPFKTLLATPAVWAI